MQGKIAAGFWSYVHADDEHEEGRIKRLRERLERSICFFSGITDFRIFLDHKDIGWGEEWKLRISDSIDHALLLFPIVTPRYFSSGPCRSEVLAFQRRQIKLGRNDLILPIYYLSADLMDDGDQTTLEAEQLEVGRLLSAHQYEDWRSLRLTEETDRSYLNAIERLAQQATQALKRGATAKFANERGVVDPAETAVVDEFLQGSDDETQSPEASADPPTSSASAVPGHIVTLTVSQMPGRAHFTTISDAVGRAPGGARIVVSPGHYRESVVFDKPLELIGEGSRDDIVIESEDAEPVIFDTNIGTIRNFTLRQTGTNGSDYCVWIKQGRLELEDCDISSTSGASVVVANYADPRIRRNRIHDGKKSGILILDARGTYEENEIFGNGLAGVMVKGTADPIVRRNRIFDGRQGGIFVYENGRGTFEDNEVSSNMLAGISVKGAANPIVRRNRIFDGRQGGIYVFESGRGTFEDNEVFGNALSGISVKGAADPMVRRNHIHDGKQSGIYVYDGGLGVFEDNEISGNKYSGVAVRNDSNPIFRRNRIHNGKQSGIYVSENGRGTFEDNEVFHNMKAGIFVKTGGNPTVHRNKITENIYEAVWVGKGGAGIFSGNDLTENKRGPWDIVESSVLLVTRKDNREK